MRNLARTWVIFVAFAVVGIGCQQEDRVARRKLGNVEEQLKACRAKMRQCPSPVKLTQLRDLPRQLKRVQSISDGRMKNLQGCQAKLKTVGKDAAKIAKLLLKLVAMKIQVAHLTGNYSDTELGKKGQKWVDNLVPESMSLSGKDLTSFVQAVGSVTYADSETVQQLWVIHKLREEAVKKVLGADKQEVFSVQNLKVGRHATLGYWRTLCTEERVTGEKTSPLWAAFIENFRVIEEPLKVKPLNSFRRYVCKCKKPDEEEVVTCQLEKIPLPGVAGTH